MEIATHIHTHPHSHSELYVVWQLLTAGKGVSHVLTILIRAGKS